MKTAMFLKPINPELIVRDPVSKTPLSINGEWKPWSGKEGNYWRRRFTDGSVVICEPSVKKEELNVKEGETYHISKGGKK